VASVLSLVLLTLGAGPERTGLRDWQLGALALAAGVAVARRPPGLDSVLLRWSRSSAVLLLGLWMLAAEVLNFQAFRVSAFDFGIFDWMRSPLSRC